MTVPQTEEEAEDAFREMDEYLSNPITTISEFYVLMYLVDIEDVDGLSYDFFELRTTLDDVLYNYAVMAVSSELAHYQQHFQVNGTMAEYVVENGRAQRDKVRNLVNRRGFSEDEAIEKVRRETKGNRDQLREAISFIDGKGERGIAKQIMIRGKFTSEMGAGEEVTKRAIKQLATTWDAFGRDDHFLGGAKEIFGRNWGADEILEYDTGWSSSYGGRPWANVCETAMRKWEMGRTAYIDLMFSIEHNNGNFLDKWHGINDNDIRRLIESVDTSQLEEMDMGNTEQIVQSIGKPQIFREVIPRLLDMAREGNLKQMFDIAVKKNRNLRGHKHLLEQQSEKLAYEGNDFIMI